MVNRLDDALNESLSAVMDGRATTADWTCVNAAWTTDPALRERWALWHAAGDGLRSAELPSLHREPEALLAGLHAQIPAPHVRIFRRREWFAPLAVAASFIALAMGIGTLRAPVGQGEVMAMAPIETPRAQALVGTSFAQTAAGGTRNGVGAAHDAGGVADAPPETVGWVLALPEPSASRPRP